MPKENFANLESAEENLRKKGANVQVNSHAVDKNGKREEVTKSISKVDSIVVALGVWFLISAFIISLYLFNSPA